MSFSLPNPRYNVACGAALSSLGGYDIVVAGGYDQGYA